jgi:hypothetical protein
MKDHHKLNVPGQGFKKIAEKEKPKDEKRDPTLFYYEDQENWLIPNDKTTKKK